MTAPTDETTEKKTKAGNYFVSNYPPFSFWKDEHAPALAERLAKPAEDPPPLGLYVHIPFCRKRCDFCYFKVYTDKNSAAIRGYLDAVLKEASQLAASPYLAGRKPSFLYFGGGTPSYLSAQQLAYLVDGLRERFDLSAMEEFAFECEPGTLSEPKIEGLRDLGVTRLSLGVENFDPDILELNNRAHRATEIYRTFAYAREVGFPTINIDLIAGMVGETDENWQRCLEETASLMPDSVTIYQMEVPHNTTIYRRMKDQEVEVAPVADWKTKRRWVSEAFDYLEPKGFRVGSAYTIYREGASFVYRDSLWHGADLAGMGVSSFGHLGGVHAQNEPNFDEYIRRVEAGELPISRALPLSDEERLRRLFVLQMKLGTVSRAWFQDEFGVDVVAHFAEGLTEQRSAGMLDWDDEAIRTTREGLLQVDLLLPAYFLPEHQGARYT